MTTRPVRRVERDPVDFDRPHYNYKAFDSYAHLLYVGCSLNVRSRLGAHRTGSTWWRFAETVGIFGPWDRAEALRQERHSIENEAPYFNSSYADMVATKSNTAAAQRSLRQQGWHYPEVEADPREDPAAWNAEWESIQFEREAWHRGVERESLRLKVAAYPFMTDEDRLARYLAARQDAELARIEAAA